MALSASADVKGSPVAPAGSTQPRNSSAVVSENDCPKRDRSGNTTELSSTAFRMAEKKYKLYQPSRRDTRRQRRPAETNFSDVVDLRNTEHNTELNRRHIRAIHVGHPDVTCYTFAPVPGLLFFPAVMSEAEQQHWCREAILSFGDAARHPSILSTHAQQPLHTRCYQPPMRWATLGFSYEWCTKTYDRRRYSSFPPALKEKMRSLMQLVARVLMDGSLCDDCDGYEPQTAIVNYYPVGSMMMCHQDISEEVLAQPLMSLSLGCSAIFLMGGQTRHEAPYAFMLRSGDVVAFAGPSRTAFHSTPRILNDCPSYLTLPAADITEEEAARYRHYTYHHVSDAGAGATVVDKDSMTCEEQERYWRLCMRHLRVNINARQVYRENCDYLFT